MKTLVTLAVAGTLGLAPAAWAQEKAAEGRLRPDTFSGLKFREIGPALTSGRVADIAVHPDHRKIYYVAVASGGVWKTVNSGTTWTPLFDAEGSYSIGAVAVDPSNPNVVWVGTGENNSQRSVGYGDGVYKSIDGGQSWKRVGLEASEHIGQIAIDPRDSDTVFVASQGPLWSAGGDRGLYRTTDGGKTWQRVLEISEHTGVSEVWMDPRNPDVMFAVAYQRRRHVWTLINGGPESGIYKSTDAGTSWTKLESGLPSGDLGRIGMAISPADPDVVYAIIEAPEDTQGFYRSTDGGATWSKRSDYVSGSPQYYQELVADPHDVDRVYSMDTWMMVTHDGGASFQQVGERAKHVDNHALWIDPADTDYLLAGCDGGVYESFDRGATWHFKANLPIVQFYKIAVDQDRPFYNVYGGTQDNFTMGGPSRSTSENGITNADWLITWGGDGFEPQVDPENPDIVYSQSQYGVLGRFDRASGEWVRIQPQPARGEALKFNWDSPLLISPHSHTRLYFGANRLFRSDDRGDSWTPVSPDLTRQEDRNRLPVMGRVWGVDAISKNRSTSIYGNLVALDESPLVEGLLYVGTDDGLLQISEDGGQGWRRVERVAGVPERTYVNDLVASVHDADTVFAAFNNHKTGDFKPYLYRSTNRGRSWTSITGDLPQRGSVYAVAEDHENPNLLFAGTEFGAFFTIDGGRRWMQLKGGIPTIAVRDLEIQRRENDLVAGTFGRGIFILDDYSPLREVSEALLDGEAELFPVKDTWMFIPSVPLGLPGKSFQGDSFYTAPNPPVGAVFTYYLKDEIKTLAAERKAREDEVREKGGDVFYPTWEELRAEDREKDPEVILTVRDADGEIVRRLTGPTGAGFHRVVWDLRYPPYTPTSLEPFPTDNPFRSPPQGPMAVPGSYTVQLQRRVRGVLSDLGEPRSFEATPLGLATFATQDRAGLLAFQRKTGRLQRAVTGAARAAEEAQARLAHLERSALESPGVPPELRAEIAALDGRLTELLVALHGDRTVESRNEATPMSISDRVSRIVGSHWSSSTAAPGQALLDAWEIAADEFGEFLPQLRQLIEVDLVELENRIEAAGAPWTPGRVPRWKRE